MSSNLARTGNYVIPNARKLAKISGKRAVCPDGMSFDPYFVSNDIQKTQKGFI